MEIDQLLVKLSKAVSYAFRKDGTCPGVLVSTLKDGDIYVSIVRYGSQFPSGKKIVCKFQASNLKTALLEVSNEFVNEIKLDNNPIDDLRDALLNDKPQVTCSSFGPTGPTGTIGPRDYTIYK